MASDVSKSWFAVFNNPHERTRPNGEKYSEDPILCCQQLRDEWIEDSNTRTGAWAYCVSADGLRHIHMVLEDNTAMRFTAVKKSYAQGMHFEATKGSKSEAEGYIKKIGKWQEKGEQVLHIETFGDIKGNQGRRNDLGQIEELIEQGKTPREIMDMSFSFRKYEKMIKDGFFSKRSKETPPKRDVEVIWHVGTAGSGKSYTYVKLCETVGEDKVYLMTDYNSGGFDLYCAEPILFMDEFKGQLPFYNLLNYLDGYKIQVHARYGNVRALWTTVHITSVYPPEEVYKAMVDSNVRALDSVEQLKRRISKIIYHYKDGDVFKEYEMKMKDYVDYCDLKQKAVGNDGFIPLTASETDVLPF